jgi:LysR family transcriptional regulator of gallate degradation
VLNEMIGAWKLSPHVQIETSCLSTIVAVLTASDRLSLLSRWHITLDGHSELARVEGPGIPHAARHVGLTTRQGWLPTPFQNAFLENLRSAALPLQESH